MKKRLCLLAIAMCIFVSGCGKEVEEELEATGEMIDYMNYSTDEMEDDLAVIEQSLYSQYDNAQMIGARVISALKTYADSADFTIFISPNSEPYSEIGAPVQAYVYCGMPNDYTEGLYTVEWSEKMQCYGCTIQDNVSLQSDMSATQDSESPDTYVDFNATYHSDLVHDKATGEVIGVLFRIITS